MGHCQSLLIRVRVLTSGDDPVGLRCSGGPAAIESAYPVGRWLCAATFRWHCLCPCRSETIAQRLRRNVDLDHSLNSSWKICGNSCRRRIYWVQAALRLALQRTLC